ncbi:hypothetical protein BRD00_12430 [Halobacteriales archaeon QS_8_69_26]|nr:MAG: hypothetical protein BRD00_12430 [Halobacteriales archaeon QS_8_69_26]
MTVDHSDGGSDDAAFARTLRDLRDEGASILVVGAVPGEVHDRTCLSFLGEGIDDHRRAFALAGRPDETVDRRLPSDANRDPDHLQVVSGECSVRSAAAGSEAGTDDAGPGGPDGPESPAVDPDPGYATVPNDPDGIREGLGDALSELADASEGPEPGEIRVCVDSVGQLFDLHEPGEVVTFCYAVAALVEDVKGIGHFHLPADPDDGRVAALEPVFDLVVELRLRDGAQQRWRTRDGTTTDWLPVGVGV